MAVADATAVSRSEQPYGREHWLPYGASALVTAAAILSAWPLYLVPSFPYLALALVAAGTLVSMYLRAIGFNRRLLNIAVLGVSLIYIFATMSRLRLPGGSDLMSIALVMEDRVVMALVIHLFLTVAMFRSFSLLTDRDLTLTLVPALSTILLAAVVAPTPGVIVALLTCFLGALYLLAFDHQETWAARAQGRRLLAAPRRRSLLARSVAELWLVLVPASLVAALVFGLVNLPRLVMLRYRNYLPYLLTSRIIQVAAPAWIMPATTLRLDRGGALRGKVMFLVESVEDALWRSNTFDTYDGTGWRNAQPLGLRQPLLRRDREWAVPPRDPGLIAGVRSSALEQVFHLEAPMQGVVIAAYEPRTIAAGLRRPRVSDSSVLTNSALLARGAVYRVVSRRKAPPGPAVYRSGVQLSAAERARYLALPRIPQRTRRLALQITAGERDDLHRALALRAYLEHRFAYRERVEPPPPGVDHVDYFLFQMDGGYCNYFASALAVMARINGIPARVVSGFRSSEEDKETGWWVVREKHAHSWAEVFIDGYGWLELDPSPIAGSAPSTLEQAQKALGGILRQVKRAALAPLRALAATRGLWWKLPLALTGLTAAALAISYLRREKVPRLPPRPEPQALREYVRRAYQRMCRWLGAWGLPKPPGATATEYGLSLERALGAQAQPMRDVIGAYLMTEYAGQPPSAALAHSAARGLKAMLRLRRQLLQRLEPNRPGQPSLQ